MYSTTSCSILGFRYPIDDKSTCKGCRRGADKGMLDDSFKYDFLPGWYLFKRLETTNQYGLVSITREGHHPNSFYKASFFWMHGLTLQLALISENFQYGLLQLCLPELHKKRIHISIHIQCPPTNQKSSNSINGLEPKEKALASRTSN